MAHVDSNRDHLLQEAVALIPRVELQIAGQSEPVVAGFRRDGCLSVYFGGDPYYQFDAEGRLRRACVDDELYRTQETTLARLERVRLPQATELRRHDMSADELAAFCDAMRTYITRLRAATAEPASVARQIPEGEPVLPRLALALDTVLQRVGTLAPPINRAR